MNPRSLHALELVAASAFAPQTLMAFDPLMDEPEPTATWRLYKEVSYTDGTAPAWQANSWASASREFAVGSTTLELEGAMGFLTQDFQLDTAWNLEPKMSATWSRERLSLEGWGWGLWNDLGWTDEGGGANLSLQLSGMGGDAPVWKTGIHGWTSENSGSAFGIGASRVSNGPRWTSGVTLVGRRLLEVATASPRPGGMRQVQTRSAVADQWQVLLQTSIDRNWKAISAGVGLDLDGRAIESDATSMQGSMGRGSASKMGGTRYTGTIDPYASVAWTPGTWGIVATVGWSTDLQQTKGAVSPVSTLWSSISTSKSW